MLSFPDRPELMLSDDILERRLRSSFEDGPSLHPPIDLFKA